MTTIFTRIIDGEIPGRFVWRDERAVAWLDIRPLAQGHALVVPRAEIDQWTDLSAAQAARCMQVAHAIGNAQKQVWSPPRIGLMIAGFEVPHVHLHVFPTAGMNSFDFANADRNPDPARLDDDMQRLRAELRALGHGEFVPD